MWPSGEREGLPGVFGWRNGDGEYLVELGVRIRRRIDPVSDVISSFCRCIDNVVDRNSYRRESLYRTWGSDEGGEESGVKRCKG